MQLNGCVWCVENGTSTCVIKGKVNYYRMWIVILQCQIIWALADILLNYLLCGIVFFTEPV